MKLIEERIARILLDDFKIRHDFIGPETTFAELSFDSLVIVELTMALDSEFGVALGEGTLTDQMTIADAAELIVGKGAVA
jgi:acyl carrier protein